MSQAWLIARHEWRRLIVQPFPWLLAAVVVALMAWHFLLLLQAWLELGPRIGGADNTPGLTGAVAVPLLRSLSQLLLLVVPLVTMGSLAGERRRHTLPLLLASGTPARALVAGKFLGAFGYLLVLILLVALMPLSLRLGTGVDLGRLAAGLAGLALFAAGLAGIGIAASAWTAQPVLAAAFTVALGGLLQVIDAGARLQGVTHGGINHLALPTHLEPFLAGRVASVHIVYFLLLAIAGLLLAGRGLQRSREAGA